MDMNDRALRRITIDIGEKKGTLSRNTGFVITAASEIMAVMALANSLEDLRRRLGDIMIGASRGGKPVRASELNATGAMMALLSEALLPNLAQTTEGVPAMVHTGPFGNIAHGTSSVISHQMGIRLADYVVNEAGFGADLGAEKYVDIVMRSSGITPACAVLVTTVQSLYNQGEGDLERGFPNLARHVANLKRLGVPVVVAINRFPKDTNAELKRIADYCAEQGAVNAMSEAFSNGGAGAEALAEKVVETVQENPHPQIHHIYGLEESLENKITKVATTIYGAAGVSFSEKARKKLEQYQSWCFGRLPVCMAKTQYSFSDNPKLLGAPVGWTLNVTDASLSAGAGYVVVISGNMMLMPGLPKAPRAMTVDVDAKGEIVGV
jgi:formate--tetrahydrofolate ligase